ncbi:hypothetical protein HEB94_000185 [Actinopolymorpha pittospori]|uniref:Uncharacterized protein n=1 Tax=Actinopolymorpha pittospori TaxID=648752 RepID=A0A927MNQ8_9ACTN|nr:hypothetical protein [Actinopolymorpha pittospori]
MHATVVLVPLAAAGSGVIAISPAIRRRYWWLVVAATGAAVISVPLATETGDGLRARLEPSTKIARHADLGGELVFFVVPLLVAVTALALLDLYQRPSRRSDGGIMTTEGAATGTARWIRPVSLILAVATLVLAVGSAVQVIRVGDAGARAAWGDERYVTPTGGD